MSRGERVQQLAALHRPGQLLLLPNAWDALSALLVERAGAQAVATSSAALAWSRGHGDGQRLPLEELLRAVRDLARLLRVPLTVDLERGYAEAPEEVAQVVARVAEAGAAGVNLEDGAGPPEALAARLRAVRQRLGGEGLFLNARTCVVLRRTVSPERQVSEVLARAARYAEAGADGLFVPGLSAPEALGAVASGTALPLNVMVTPELPSPAELRRLGVRRLSAGPRLAEVAYSAAAQAAAALLQREDLAALRGPALGYPELQAIFVNPGS